MKKIAFLFMLLCSIPSVYSMDSDIDEDEALFSDQEELLDINASFGNDDGFEELTKDELAQLKKMASKETMASNIEKLNTWFRIWNNLTLENKIKHLEDAHPLIIHYIYARWLIKRRPEIGAWTVQDEFLLQRIVNSFNDTVKARNKKVLQEEAGAQESRKNSMQRFVGALEKRAQILKQKFSPDTDLP